MKKQLLLVEDTAALAESVADVFRMEGFDVTIATNGQEALDALDKDVFDLVITDLVMPVMDGETLMTEMSRCNYSGKMPIIVLSAKNIEDKQEQYLRNQGVDLILNKTVKIEILLTFVSKLLDRK